MCYSFGKVKRWPRPWLRQCKCQVCEVVQQYCSMNISLSVTQGTGNIIGPTWKEALLKAEMDIQLVHECLVESPQFIFVYMYCWSSSDVKILYLLDVCHKELWKSDLNFNWMPISCVWKSLSFQPRTYLIMALAPFFIRPTSKLIFHSETHPMISRSSNQCKLLYSFRWRNLITVGGYSCLYG